MSGKVAIMSDKTSLAVAQNTAHKMRLVRAELALYFERNLTMNETVAFLAMLYDRCPDREQLLTQINAEILGNTGNANVE